MDFSLIGPDKLKVDLTAQDLAVLGLGCDQLDYKDEHTRRVLVDLIARGRAVSGFSPCSSKLYIEIYPRQDGGCVIYYTRLATGQLDSGGSFLPGVAPIVFAFEDPETLLRACSKAYALYRHRILKSCLYTRGRHYRLIVYPLDLGGGAAVCFLREYARLVGEGSVLAAHIEEHWKQLTGENARGRHYRLIIYPLDLGGGAAVCFLREYARLVGEGSVLAAHIEEHWQQLTGENALETLAEIEGAT